MPDQTKSDVPSAAPSPVVVKPVKFIHEKGAQYRVYHADEIWGVMTNFGNLQIDFCVQRPPTPSSVVHPVNPDGTGTGEQHMSFTEDDPRYFNVVRDFQCGVVLSLATAIQLRSALDYYISNTKQQMNATLEQIKKTP